MEKEIELKIDVDELYLDDLEALEGSLGAKALLDVLDRCVVGGVRGRKIPLRQMKTIAGQVKTALMSDLKN